MNKLLINNSLAVINNDTKFPFSHKINDLDNFSIIGLPGSKTVELIRCQQNDEIFGHIGEITRTTFNFDNDEKISISFNQTKKCSYTLLDGSEVISSGKLIITNIDEQNYYVDLYDELVYLLEQFEGNSDDNTGYLSNLDIYNGNTPISLNLYSDTIASNLTNTFVKPIININEDDLTNTNIRCLRASDGNIINLDLPEDCSQLQVKSLKTYDVEYAVPVAGVINSINKLYPNTVTFNSQLTTLFNDVHLYCGKPKYNIVSEDKITKAQGFIGSSDFIYQPSTNSTVNLTTSQFIIPIKDNADQYITRKNGKYYFEYPISLLLSQNDSGSATLINSLSYYGNTGFYYTNSTNNNVPVGTKFGELFYNFALGSYSGTTVYEKTKYITNKINLVSGVSAVPYLAQGNTRLRVDVNATLVMEFDYYPTFDVRNASNLPCFVVTFPNLQSNTWLFTDMNGGFRRTVGHFINFSISNTGKMTYTNYDKPHTGDVITGKNIFNKVPIKNFLLTLVKTFNLKITNVNNVLHIDKKLYNTTDEQLNIVKINSINTKLFDFSKLVLKSKICSDTNVNDEYTKITKETYGQKNINTNYSIRKNTKTVEFEYGTPTLMQDTNKFAYDMFNGYFNAGRSRSKYGCVKGFDDTIVFGFLNSCTEDQMYLTNDTYFEANMLDNNESNIPESVDFKKTNWKLSYDSINNTYSFYDTYPTVQYFDKLFSQNTKITTYNTLSPYKFNLDGNIQKSLEVNKPKYTFGNIKDSQYSDDVTLYSKHFKNQITDTYNVNTHILDADIYFNFKPDVNKIYNHKNVNYIISELTEYDPTGGLSTGVKLQKVNDVNNYLYPYGIEEGVVSITNFSDITMNSIKVNNNISYTGGDTFVKGGVKYGYSLYGLSNDVYISNPTTNFSVNMTGLNKNTLYYVQPYLIGASGIITYGTTVEVRTLDDFSTPTMIVNTPYYVSYTTATFNGVILSQGGANITKYGFVYSTSNTFPTLSDSTTFVTGNHPVGTFEKDVTGLTDDTLYYVRSFSENINGVSYSTNVVTFTTLKINKPTLRTTIPTNVRQLDGYSGGYSINNNGANLTQKGIVIKVAGGGTPTTSNYDVKIIDPFTTTNDFTSYFLGLPFANEAYVVRSYAINSKGTGYGDSVNFSTTETELATVTITPYVTNLNLGDFDVSATLNYTGGDQFAIEEYGFVYSSVNTNPTDGGADCTTVYHAQVPLNNEDVYTVSFTGLDLNTTYYIRAIVLNSAGTAYSTEVLQVVTENILPEVLTISMLRTTNSNFEIANFTGELVTNGNIILTKGFVYSTVTATPMVDYPNCITISSSGGSTGLFYGTDYNLTESLGSYYCRAFIQTYNGYIYGDTINDLSDE